MRFSKYSFYIPINVFKSYIQVSILKKHQHIQKLVVIFPSCSLKYMLASK
jgi:hypothetical protein